MTAKPAPAASAWNLPNILTGLRIVLVPFFAWDLIGDHNAGGQTALRWIAVVLFCVAIYTDKLDGDLARSRGLITNFGKIADPIADKLLLGTALILLSAFGELWWWVSIIVLVREIGITVLRFAVIRHGVMPASRGGKLKTVLQTVAVLLYLLPMTAHWAWLGWAAAIVMAAAFIVTLVTGIDYVLKAMKLVRS